MTTTIEIFSQGEELVTGQIVDTNARWLSARLVQLGFTVSRHTTVGDKLDDLVSLLQEVATRADCCICTGGLGPTLDDLTAEAVAIAFNRPLVFDAIAYQQISDYFKHRDRSMPESNRKQALLPQGAERLDNDWGTAPGFALQQGQCWFFFVPGVPMEMKQLYHERIQPRLLTNYTVQPWQLIIIKTIGIGESDIAERLQDLKLPVSVQLSFRASSVEIQTKLLFPPDYPRLELESLSRKVAQTIGDPVFTIEGVDQDSGELIEIVDQLLSKNQQTLALVETLSQGLIASQCIGVDGLIESLFCRDQQQLLSKLDLPEDTDLAASEQLALNYARQIRNLSGADLGLAQCYAPINNVADNQQITCLTTAMVSATAETSQQINISGSLSRQQQRATLQALDFVRRFILKNY